MEERKTTQDGFTLIEVMIVAAIIAIIAAIAYPNYAESVKKAKRAVGTGELTSLAQKLERCQVSKGSYNAADCPSGTGLGTENRNYLIDISATANAYELVAKPQFADDKCGNLTLKHTMEKGASGSEGVRYCW